MTDRLHLQHLGACRTAFEDSNPACARVLMIGEDNPQSAEPEHALYCAPDGVAGHRLQSKILGISRLDYLAIWRANLCCPTWNLREARERARVLLPQAKHLEDAVPWEIVVLLGAKVAKVVTDVLGVMPMRPFDYRRWCRAYVEVPRKVTIRSEPLVCLPHPSGRCRAWNDPSTVHKARAAMASAVPEIPWGSPP